MTGTAMDDLLPHRPALLAFLTKVTGQAALAEDLSQETFLKAQKAHGPRENPKAWLFSIGLNAARDHFRTARRRKEESVDTPEAVATASETESAEQALMRSEMSHCISDYMTRLPQTQYDVLVLHEEGGLSHREIAEIMGLSEANARVTLHRAKAALKEIFSDNCRLSFGENAVPCERKHPAEKSPD